MIMGIVAGNAAGNALGGALVDGPGYEPAVLAAAGDRGGGAVLAYARR